MKKKEIRQAYENGQAHVKAIKSEAVAISINVVDIDHGIEDCVIGFTRVNDQKNWFRRKLDGSKFKVNGYTYDLNDFMHVDQGGINE